MAKSKYEKMEIMLEEIMNETDLDTKIEEMKEDIKEEPKGTGNSKEEYRKSLQEDKKRKEGLSKKLKFYEAYKNNKNEILNIRDYQLSLQARLEKLEKEKSIVENVVKNSEHLNSKIEEIDKELEEIMQKRENIAQQLKNKELSDEDREKLLKEDEKLARDRDMNAQKYQVIQNFKGNDKSSEHRDVEEISKEILNTQIKISKCNMIWSSLLKGKDWNQIEVVLNTGDFTAKKGTIDKIRNLKDASQLNNNNKTNIKNLLKGTQHKVNTGVTNLPQKTKTTFKDRHPRLAKIPFLAKIVDKFNDYRDNSKVNIKNINTNTNNIGTNNVVNTNLENSDDEKALKYIDKRMEKNEVEMFKSIAKNGFKESMKVDLEQRRAEMKRNAAEKESDRFGGKYKIENNNGR